MPKGDDVFAWPVHWDRPEHGVKQSGQRKLQLEVGRRKFCSSRCAKFEGESKQKKTKSKFNLCFFP